MTEAPPLLDEPTVEDNIPPQDLAAEMAVLGSMLTGRDVIDDVSEIIAGPDFYRPAHEVIFNAACTLHWSGSPVDPITVADALTKTGDLARAGGATYLHELLARVVAWTSATYYADLVAERAVQRRMLTAATSIAALARSGMPASDMVAAAEAEVDRLAAGRTVDAASLADTVEQVLHEIDYPDTSDCLETPWPSLNSVMRGMRPGRVYVVGARPGVGKSVLAMNAAVWWAQRHGKAVAVSSIEMPRDEVTRRCLASMSGVEYAAIESGSMTPFQRSRVDEAAATLRAMPPVSVDDRESVDPTHVRAHARAVARRTKNLGLVVIDYLQLMEASAKAENRQQEVARFSRQIKKLARSLEVPVLLLSQLNRGSEMRGPDSPPRLSDLRDSGAVEQDADVVLLLHRGDDDTTVHVKVAKNRQGPKQTVALDFDGARMRMTERAWTPSGAIA